VSESVSSESILVELNGGVLHLTLNRPDRLNILDVETRRSLMSALKTLENSSEVRCVLMSSKGEVFSAGADLRYILELSELQAREYTAFVKSVLDYVEAYPKPTIGLVDGLAVGGALELLLALDMVLATPNARFGLTELNVGLIPGGGGSQRLPRIVGVRKAKEMIFTGSLINADEALSLGLVNRVVPRESLMAEAMKICEKITAKSPAGLRLAKQSLNQSLYSSMGDGLRFENALYTSMVASPDAKERIKAFLERRKETAQKGG